MFALDTQQVGRCDAFNALDGIVHGFGTRLSTDWPAGGQVISLRQVHSNRVIVASPSVCGVEGDALITDQPGLLLTIRTADCMPILLADPRRMAVAAIHAGWRGAIAEIVPAAVCAMAENFGSRPKDLVAAIGPGIGVCCYEVGPEVAEMFRPGQQGVRIDLAEVNRQQLMAAGVLNIYGSGSCTRCQAALFHSYRRDGDAAGRMIAAIGLKGV